MKKVFIILSFILAAFNVNAQQDLTLSQQFFSRINKNPAGIGNITDIDAFFLGRYQWTDMKDSPKSGVFNIQHFRDNLHSGFGFTMSYDNLGVAKQMYNPKLVYDYCLKIQDEMLLTLGLSAGIQYGYFDPTRYTIDDIQERGLSTFPDKKQTKVSPDFDFGAEFITPTILVGFSTTHITESEATSLKSDRHYYLYGRYLAALNESWALAPTVTWMHHNNVQVTELNVTAFYQRLFWGGLTYHPDLVDKFGSNPLAVTLGLEYQNFRLGYTFDYTFGKVADYSASAHELMLSYSFRSKNSAPKYDRFE